MRADASTVWKEFTTPEGRKYYYNKVTKQSKWVIPDDLRIAREQAEKAANPVTNSEGLLSMAPSPVPVAVVSSPAKASPNISVSSITVTPTVLAPTGPSTVSASAMPLMPTNPAPLMASVIPTVPTLIGAVSPVPTVTLAAGFMPTITVASASITTPPVSIPSNIVVPVATTSAATTVVPVVTIEAMTATIDTTLSKIGDSKEGGMDETCAQDQEYLAQRKKHEAEERRIRQKRAWEDFIIMLEESKELTSATRWSKAVTLFESDARFHAVDRGRDREELFEGYLVELERKEWEKAREARKRNIIEYRTFLESCDFIKANSRWRKVQDRLEDDERCSRLDKIDRLEIFQEYIRDLEMEEEERKIQKEQLCRKERKNQDEFRRLMEDHEASGLLTAKTRWRDYCTKVKDHPAYLAVASNTSGSTPKDLFEDVAEEIQKQYQEDKANIKDALKAGKFTVTSQWTLDKFKASIGEVCDLAAASETNLKLVFEEVLERTWEEKEKEAKKRQRVADDFMDLLYSLKVKEKEHKRDEEKLVFEEVLERTREKEEKEAKKGRRVLDDFRDLLYSLEVLNQEAKRRQFVVDDFMDLLYYQKEIVASSKWEECIPLLEDAREYRAVSDESFRREMFDEYVAQLQEKVKEKECKRDEEKAKKERKKEEKEKAREKRKEKEREKKKEKEREKKEKDKERDREKGKDRSREDRDSASYIVDVVSSHAQEEWKKDKEREKEKDRKHKKRHASTTEDVSSGKEEREESKKSCKHTSDRKRSSRKHGYESGSDSETRHKHHWRDRDGSRIRGA